MGVMARSFFTGAGSRTDAFAGIATVRSNLSFACHRLDRRRFLARRVFEAEHITAFKDPVGTLPYLLGQTVPISGDTAKRLVAARLQGGQHPVEQFKVRQRLFGRLCDNGELIEMKSAEYCRNLIFGLFISFTA